MDEPKLSPVGEIVLAALTDLEKHLEIHDCPTCVTKTGTLIKALTEWHSTVAQSQTEKGEIYGSKEERVKPSKEQGKEPDKGEAGKKPSWDIFSGD